MKWRGDAWVLVQRKCRTGIGTGKEDDRATCEWEIVMKPGSELGVQKAVKDAKWVTGGMRWVNDEALVGKGGLGWSVDMERLRLKSRDRYDLKSTGQLGSLSGAHRMIDAARIACYHCRVAAFPCTVPVTSTFE